MALQTLFCGNLSNSDPHKASWKLTDLIPLFLADHQVMTAQQIHSPLQLPTEEQLLLVHTPEYLTAFSNGTLDTSLIRRYTSDRLDL